MPSKGEKKPPRRVIVLDGDKLGHVVGAVVATTVMAFCFFYQKVDGYTVAIRAGWAFVISYGATFFLVRVILRITLQEYVLGKRQKKDEDSQATDGQ